jgi:hypothetical protein
MLELMLRHGHRLMRLYGEVPAAVRDVDVYDAKDEWQLGFDSRLFGRAISGVRRFQVPLETEVVPQWPLRFDPADEVRVDAVFTVKMTLGGSMKAVLATKLRALVMAESETEAESDLDDDVASLGDMEGDMEGDGDGDTKSEDEQPDHTRDTPDRCQDGGDGVGGEAAGCCSSNHCGDDGEVEGDDGEGEGGDGEGEGDDGEDEGCDGDDDVGYDGGSDAGHEEVCECDADDLDLDGCCLDRASVGGNSTGGGDDGYVNDDNDNDDV